MTLCEGDTTLKQFITTEDGFKINLLDTMLRGSVAFYRQATSDGRGGGFVAANSYVPPHIAIPHDWTIYENTRVFDDADLAGAGPRIVGLVYRVSKILQQDELPLLEAARMRRVSLRAQWELSNTSERIYATPRGFN